MSKTKPKVRRQMLILFCALLLFGQFFVQSAYAETVVSRVMRKIVCRLWLNEVSRQ